MSIRSSTWSETWRVLAYTLVIALAFVALDRLQLAAFNTFGTTGWLGRIDLIGRHSDSELLKEAAQVAAESRPAVPRLPPGHRLAALRLGYEVGYASEWVGAFFRSSVDTQTKAREIGEAHLALAREQAQRLGIQQVAALPVNNLKQGTELNERFEADENGMAENVQKQLSPLHRHLYILGALLGTETARVEVSGGHQAFPPAPLIRRHAMLAGIAPSLWLPLTIDPHAHNETPEQVVSRYRSALNALAAAMAQQSEAPDRLPTN